MIEVVERTLLWGRRPLYFVKGDKLLGYIGFGVIDRGTNVLQVRPTTICPLSCIFCSVDAGPLSINRWAEFIVGLEGLLNTVDIVARYKETSIEALIDTIGEALTYPWITRLIKELKTRPYVSSVALETHGALLTRKTIDRLDDAGLDRINLSIDTLNPEKARFLQGTPWYNVKRVMEMAEYLVRETNIDLHVTPVWIPGVNDDDVVQVIKWAIRIGAGKRWPPVTIQKYNAHKYGRKLPGVKPLSWRCFWEKIEELEARLGVKLRWSLEEWGMRKARRYPAPFKKGDRVYAKVLSRGVFRGEYIGVTMGKEWLITLRRGRLKPGDIVAAYVTEDQDGLLIGRTIGRL